MDKQGRQVFKAQAHYFFMWVPKKYQMLLISSPPLLMFPSSGGVAD